MKRSVAYLAVCLVLLSAGTIVRGESPSALKKNMVLRYSFDRNERDQVTDDSGNQLDGSLHGTEWVPTGKIGGARVFNGKSDYVSRTFDAASPLFPVDTPFSVSAWFKTVSAKRIQQVILATHYAGYGRDGYFLVIDGISRKGKLYWFPGTQEAGVTSRSAVTDGQWHHAVGVWDGKQSCLYLDGVLQGKVPASTSLVYSFRAPFQVGHMTNNGAPHARDEIYYFKGTIDEVMVFNRALSAVEVKALSADQRVIAMLIRPGMILWSALLGPLD